MNWYTLIKISSPILENLESPVGYSEYTDFGHEISDPGYDEVNTMLWFIDGDLQFHLTPHKYGEIHHNWDEFAETLKNKNLLAQGRYDKNKHEASFVLAFPKEMPQRFRIIYNYRQDKLVKNLEKILDQKLGNPTIHVFE